MDFPKHDPPDADQPHHSPDLERRFLRMGVEGMEAERRVCIGCGRSPLVGERLTIFAPAGQEIACCDICRAESYDDTLGEPLRVVRTRATERRLNVRRAA